MKDKSDFSKLEWHKSAQCGESGHCVEVAHTKNGTLVRDSKNQNGPVLTFDKAEWQAFLAGAKNHEFDRAS